MRVIKREQVDMLIVLGKGRRLSVLVSPVVVRRSQIGLYVTSFPHHKRIGLRLSLRMNTPEYPSCDTYSKQEREEIPHIW